MSQNETSPYFERYGYKPKLVSSSLNPNTKIIIVIPCFNENNLIKSLESLKNCTPTISPVEVIVVINQSESISEEINNTNLKCFNECLEWIKSNNSSLLTYHCLFINDLPKKHAGVGLARKIGMDEASRRFNEINYDRGLIVCFDADSTVNKNYLISLEEYEKDFPKSTGCSIHFEHPLEGDLPVENYTGILNYELHLRYYIHALRYSGFKLAHQTIGSSMAVRSNIYQKQGGMNRRKAGEDFYFLSKIIPLGNFHDLTTTTVHPSPRESDRVPFGTGKAITEFINKDNLTEYYTYNFKTFFDLKVFLELLPELYQTKSIELIDKLPASVLEYLKTIDYQSRLKNILNQSPKWETFVNRFYSWFDGLTTLKYVHFCRDNFYSNTEIQESILQWNNTVNLLSINSDSSKKEILLQQRKLDRSNSN